MTFSEYISDRLGQIVLHGISTAATAVFLLATGTQSGVLVLLLVAWLLIYFTALAVDFIKLRAQLRQWNAIMDGLDQKYLFAECVPKPRGVYQRSLFSLMRRASKSMIESVSDAQASQREYREYVESWVHEIKTPITAAQLICQSADPQTRRKLSQELAQIENHVERALFYARAESPEKDFIIAEINLAELTAQAIQRHRTLLIQCGVRIETEGLDCFVYTDSKWACFLLGQLLQNAARYRSQSPVVALSARHLGRQVQLTVQDNGIGIPTHELPRVFDRGFTGSNGRCRGGSTGMGLYLCRQLAEALEIDLRVASEVGKGTCVTLTFPSKDNLTKA